MISMLAENRNQYIYIIGLILILPCMSTGEEIKPFSVGERLDFKVYFEFVLGGNASMTVKKIENVNGSDCYHIISEAHSTRTVDMFYKVRDRIESWRDIENGNSRRYKKNLREGKHRDQKLVEYDTENSIAYLYRGSRTEPESLEVAGGVQDVLSAFYAMRTKSIEVGKSNIIDVHDIDKRYNLEVKVLRKERITVPAGEFECFVIEPALMSSGIFRREGRMQIWITDDEYKMPVLMRSKLYFGSVWAKLTAYKRGE